MKKTIRQFGRRIFIFFPLLFLFSCTGAKPDAWIEPVNKTELARLENKTLAPGLSKARRAQLFFLWGQELAERAKQAPDQNTVFAQAIGAFERVVDFDSVLVNESRFNLEILWRQQDQQNKQDQQKKQDQQNQQNKPNDQNRQNGKDEQSGQNKKNGQTGQDKQNQQQQGKNGQQQKGQQQNGNNTESKIQPKDMSALVRETKKSSELDNALKAESARLEQQQQQQQKMQGGGVVPVEKDW